MNDRIAPKIDNAPGLRLKERRRPQGWIARWQARTDLKRRGYAIKERTLLFIGDEPTDDERAYLAGVCQSLQDDMLVWSREGIPVAPAGFDGMLRSLIRCYQTDPDSSYKAIRYHTRKNYDSFLKRLEDEHGYERLAEIKGRQIKRWDEEWGQIGRPTARGMIMILRVILGFGTSILEDTQCQRLRGLLSAMRFKGTAQRKEVLELDQVIAIRERARKIGYPSIALAQAFQFECTLRQRDVIGEWIPLEEKGPPSDIWDVGRQWRWLRGLRWSEIDNESLKLVHVTSKRDKEIEVDLHNAPMVIEELMLSYPNGLPSAGPVIVCERTGKPWNAASFRRDWRKIATACGVPKSVYNMDTRAGAITEGTDSGAAIEDVRHAAAHSNIAMTQKYSRQQARKTAKVMKMRVEARVNKTGT